MLLTKTIILLYQTRRTKEIKRKRRRKTREREREINLNLEP
jgi:hypothetical protein